MPACSGTRRREGTLRWRGPCGGRRTWRWRCGCCHGLQQHWWPNSWAQLPRDCPATGTRSPAWQVYPFPLCIEVLELSKKRLPTFCYNQMTHAVLANAHAVVCMQMVASARPDMQRSRMAGGNASMAGSMLLRAATMGPGQCLNAEAFLPDGEDCNPSTHPSHHAAPFSLASQYVSEIIQVRYTATQRGPRSACR